METEDKSAVLPFKSQGGHVCFLRELCCCYLQHLYVFVSVNFEINLKTRLYNEHYPSILVTFWGETEHFSEKNGALQCTKAHTLCEYLNALFNLKTYSFPKYL